jgi:hypothetical protein
MNVNCKKFRFSTYEEHKITGNSPIYEFRCTSYKSGDNNGNQLNYSIKIWLTTFHFKWRYD